MPALTRLTLWYAGGVALAIMLRVATLAALAMGMGAALFLIADRRRSRTHVFGGAFALTGVALGWLALQQHAADCRLALRDRQTVVVTGAMHEVTERSARLALHSIGGRPCTGPIRLMLRRPSNGPAPEPGQVVQVRGEWWSNLNARPLDPPFGVLTVQSWRATSERSRIAELQGRASARITRLFGDQAPLAAALLIAQRDDIDPDVKQNFAASGLAHLLAISGTHVALVATVLALLASVMRLSTGIGSLLAALGSCLYVLFLGAPYPAVRAALQIVLVLVARSAQRPAHPLGLLAVAGLAILVYDPLALLDAGFQLSFAGLLGIVLWRRPLIERQPDALPLVLRDAIATSTAASIATTPIVAWHFGQVSLVSVPANLVALPLVTLAVPAAAFALAVSALWVDAALFLADGTRLLLARLEDCAAIAAGLPGGHFFLTRGTVIAVITALITGLVFWRKLWFMQRPARLATACGLACLPPLIAPVLPGLPSDAIEIHAIDVGQGDAIAIRSTRGRWVLIDAGPRSPRFDAGAARVVPFLLRGNAHVLELLVLTHPHLDHIGGAASVMNILETRIVVDPDSGRGVRAALGGSALREPTLGWRVARPGMQLTIDEMTLEILHPNANSLDPSQDPNDFSVVLRLGFGQFAALFTGDAPARVEDELLERYGARLDVDLLKVGHHGSGTSTGDAWLKGSTPRTALISVGRGNRYGHPAANVIARLEQAGVQVHRTDRTGNISLRVYRDGRIAVLDP